MCRLFIADENGEVEGEYCKKGININIEFTQVQLWGHIGQKNYPYIMNIQENKWLFHPTCVCVWSSIFSEPVSWMWLFKHSIFLFWNILAASC